LDVSFSTLVNFQPYNIRAQLKLVWIGMTPGIQRQLGKMTFLFHYVGSQFPGGYHVLEKKPWLAMMLMAIALVA